MLCAILDDGVGDKTHTDGRVETGTKGICSSDACEKSHDNTHGRADSDAVAGGVLTLDHQDDTHEDKCANNLVNKNVDVHGKSKFCISIVNCTSQRVLRGQYSEDWIILS